MIHTCLFCDNEVKIELLKVHLKQNHSTSGREYWSLISSLNGECDKLEDIPKSDITEYNKSEQVNEWKREHIEIEDTSQVEKVKDRTNGKLKEHQLASIQGKEKMANDSDIIEVADIFSCGKCRKIFQLKEQLHDVQYSTVQYRPPWGKGHAAS